MKTHYSCADLAALRLPDFPTTRQGFELVVARETWSFVEEKSRGRGGIKRLYAPPPAVLKKIRAQEALFDRVDNPRGMTLVMNLATEALRRLEEEDAQALADRQQRAEAFLQTAAVLSGHEALSLKAHCEIAKLWALWCKKNQPIKRSHAFPAFAAAWARGEVPADKAIRTAYPEFSARSLIRWVTRYERGDYGALIDRRNGSGLKGKTVFSVTPLLAAYAKKILIERPGITTENLHALLATSAIDATSGEVLFEAPSYHQCYRFQKAWIAENSELYLQQTNPDAWKNRAMVAYGNASEDVLRLNQRWEMDATPADWLLLDPDGKKRRYTVSCVIDNYCRRSLVVVAPTPKTQTHCYALRLALLAWGVPEQIVTDNGADYQADHFQRVLGALGIEQRTTAPFSGEEKPHIERFIGTLNHSILELLPNFAGHNVAERKAIEARRSFAERLARKGEIVDFADVVDGSCTGEFLQARINEWLAGIYEQREHGGLNGASPFRRAAAWTGEVRRIRDERALDLLLARPAGNDGRRTAQKKGLLIDGAWFVHPELARIDAGNEVDVFETEDLGRIVVHHENTFLCIAECPERTGASRAEIAALAAAVQKEKLKEARKKLKEETRGSPDIDDLLGRHLREKAAAAGKLVLPGFDHVTHTSHGLEQARRAARALDGAAQGTGHMVIGGVVMPVSGLPKATVTTLPAPAAKPRSERSAAENHAEWSELKRRQEAGETLSTLDANFVQRWPGSNQGRAYLKRAG
ncbi:MAG: DDE-type integrase/transposase/recombinase [Dechloromonas sp.]|jgi:putative transposase|nr:DDE-type integrase/transposase/recombinase [Dechloromonas sp.]